MKKIIKIILLVIAIALIFATKSFASYVIEPDEFKPSYKTDISEAKNLGRKIYGYIVNIAAVSSVAIIAYLGLKFMLGSVDQKAEYKKSFMPLIVGMFIVLSASTIMGSTWRLLPKKSTLDGHKCYASLKCTGGTCSTCGKVYEGRGGHSYKDGRCTYCLEQHRCPDAYLCYGGTCSTCGKKFTMGGHKYYNGTCLRCGNTEPSY